MKKLLILCFLGTALLAMAQDSRQNIRGRTIDADSREPLPGVNIFLMVNGTKTGAVSDDDGYFLIPTVPLGRYEISATYVGYESRTLSNISVNSGKETYLNIELTEAMGELDEVVVRNFDRRGSYNEMATLSSRTFNAEEAERYAGSRQDPARMASRFAGVQGTDDSRNDIVVRGNSPLGVLWRFEGIDIPNPSHFSIAGTTGGPLSILNNKVIGNSDFMTGAFPAEYGNALSGVFDIQMRNGNYNKHEFTGQLGILGLELMAEGPLSKESKATYLATYRYSTFSLLQGINVNLGTSAVPQYQDASFKLNFPLKDNSTLSAWGIGGLSNIDIVFSDDTEPAEDLYAEIDRDQYFSTNMFATGLSWKKFFKNKMRLDVTLAQTGQQILADHDFIYWDQQALRNGQLQLDSLRKVLGSSMFEGNTALHVQMAQKHSTRFKSSWGLIGERLAIKYIDSSRNEFGGPWVTKMDANEAIYRNRLYYNAQFRLSSRMTITGGLHLMHFSKSNDLALEPRAGLNFAINERSKISAAYGLHSRNQPMYVYYTRFTDSITKSFSDHNSGIGLSKSHHFVAAYDLNLKNNMRLKLESYYQHLFNIPVESRGGSYSILNQGSGFERFFPDVLENRGLGRNYGVEATIEKFFSKQFFLLGTGSVFNSEYQGKDGVWRPTDFNSTYALNLLGGYEWNFGKDKKHAFSLGTAITTAGGRRYSPVDTAATRANGLDVVFISNQRNSLRFDPYFRWDAKIGLKLNTKGVTHEFAIDLINLTNRENVLTVTYANDPENPGSRILVQQPQLLFLPLFYYKVDF